MSTPLSTPEPHTPEPPVQTITRCDAGRGWLWWVEAFRMIKEAPVPWYGIGLGYFVITTALFFLFIAITAANAWIGVLGLLVVYSLIPCFVVGFVAAGWTQARGGTPTFSHLFSGFKADVKTLMGVGAAMVLLASIAIFIFLTMLGSDFAAELKSLSEKNDPVATLAFLTSSQLWLALLVLAILGTLVWFAVWLAPMVVVFQRAGVVRAMSSSLNASLINWRALSVWLLVPLVGSFAVGMALGFVIAVLGLVLLALGLGNEAMIISFLVWGLELLIAPFLISLGALTAFVAYCDIFHAKDAVFPRAGKTPPLHP
ncbi:MAG: hypothetical protein FWC38_09100 [Proteobacteria bacterium]|nr:hypothetical protein [Pseudomonadota bacterium]MCL2308356.1 hypothetical protein [Pseudomonadota bacterium]